MAESNAFESAIQAAYERWAGEVETGLDASAFVRTTHPATAKARGVAGWPRTGQPLGASRWVKRSVWIAIVTALGLVAVVVAINLSPGANNVAAPRPSASVTPTVSPSPAASSRPTLAPVPSFSSTPSGSPGFPGARENSPGLYSWRSGSPGWMHKHVEGAGGIEITFTAVAEDRFRGGAVEHALNEDDVPHSDGPVRVADLVTQVWVLDVAGTRVGVIVESSLTTRASDLAEAEAIVRSIRGEPIQDGAVLLTFSLPAGWDSG
jgi:hypothetical protein